MTNQQFSRLHRTINRIAEIIAQLPLEEYLSDLKLADLAGCATNPDLHADAQSGLENMKQQAETLLYAQKVRLGIREDQSDEVNTSNAIAAQAWLHNLGV